MSEITASFVLVFDVGTQSTRALLFDSKGNLVEKIKKDEMPYISQNDNRAEKDPDESWAGICAVSRAMKEKAGKKWDNIVAVAVTSVRNSLFFLDKEKRPTRNAILWLDKREVICPDKMPFFNRFLYALAGMGETARVSRKTSYTNWVRVNEPEIWQKTDKIVMPTAWFNYKFTGRLADSKAGQAAKFPYNYRKRDWMTPRALNYPVFGCPVEKMCELVEPGEIIGYVTKECSLQTGIKQGIPLVATGADKACETIGNGCLSKNTASVSLGTAASVQITTDKYVEPETFMPAYTSVVKGKFNPEIQIFRGYWMVSWFKEQFALNEKIEAENKGVSAEKILDEKLQQIPIGSNGLILQPYWGPGLKTPQAKGIVLGFSDVHTRIHVYRAIIEGIGYALFDGLENIQRRARCTIDRVAVSGGGSQSDIICKITADIMGRDVYRVQTFETSGLGCAIVCFTTLGYYNGFEEAVKNMVRVKDVFKPDKQNHDKYMQYFYKVYKKIYERNLPIYNELYKMMQNDRL